MYSVKSLPLVDHYGGVDIASYFMNRSIHPFAGALGLIVLLIGIWIFLLPGELVSLIPIVIGVDLAYMESRI